MDAKQKAKELVDKMYNPGFDANNNVLGTLTKKQAKQCALIAVDEIIENIKEWDFTNDNSEHHLWFWSNVKNEIEQL